MVDCLLDCCAGLVSGVDFAGFLDVRPTVLSWQSSVRPVRVSGTFLMLTGASCVTREIEHEHAPRAPILPPVLFVADRAVTPRPRPSPFSPEFLLGKPPACLRLRKPRGCCVISCRCGSLKDRLLLLLLLSLPFHQTTDHHGPKTRLRPPVRPPPRLFSPGFPFLFALCLCSERRSARGRPFKCRAPLLCQDLCCRSALPSFFTSVSRDASAPPSACLVLGCLGFLGSMPRRSLLDPNLEGSSSSSSETRASASPACSCGSPTTPSPRATSRLSASTSVSAPSRSLPQQAHRRSPCAMDPSHSLGGNL